MKMKHLKEGLIKQRGIISSKKYELTEEAEYWFGHTLHRIKALNDIPSMKVKKGDLGGWIESEDNLDQKGNCWVGDDAKVYDKAKVYGNAKVYKDAWICGSSKVYGNAEVHGNAYVYDGAEVYGNAKVYGEAMVSGNARVCGAAKIDSGKINKGKIEK